MREWVTEEEERDYARKAWRLHLEAWVLGILIMLPFAVAMVEAWR